MTIDPQVDQLVEPDESVLVTLATGSGYTIGTASSATGVILNDDESTVDVTIDPTSILEDADGVLTYTFTRDNVSAETPALTVNFGTTGDCNRVELTTSPATAVRSPSLLVQLPPR